jgi:RNA-directed DNA polymerase
MMHGQEKSDLSIVATKLANKPGKAEAEPVERRGGAKGNTDGLHTRRTQSRISRQRNLLDGWGWPFHYAVPKY